MRDLTEEELKLAPDWATHYWVHDGKVMFESVDLFQLLNNRELTDSYSNDSGYITSFAVEIKRKPFDIGEYYFSSSNINGCIVDCGFLNLSFSVSERGCFFDKDDAIAIAKALGVTGEDLL